MFEIFTKDNDDAFYLANRTNPSIKGFMKSCYDYTKEVCARWKIFKIGKTLSKFVPKMFDFYGFLFDFQDFYRKLFKNIIKSI